MLDGLFDELIVLVMSVNGLSMRVSEERKRRGGGGRIYVFSERPERTGTGPLKSHLMKKSNFSSHKIS